MSPFRPRRQSLAWDSNAGKHFSANMPLRKHELAPRYVGAEKNVWVEFGALNAQHNTCNLGQGFPDMKHHSPPASVRAAMTEVITGDNLFFHQYTRSYGHPRLVNALAKLYAKLLNRQIDAMKEILITVGAYGSLHAAVNGLVQPGDEVIIIEPFFDCYEPFVRIAGGIPVFIPLRRREGSDPDAPLSSADWVLDPVELASKFSTRTRMIMVNTPHNPVGKIFSESELKMIADLCVKHDAIYLSDEVYEHLVYKGSQHIRVASLPGMWERTITVGSAGKTFSCTGWKLGWSIGPANLLTCLQTVHQNTVYTCPTPIQEAVAVGFEHEMERLGSDDCYFHSLPNELESKRDKLASVLSESGFIPYVPEGGYFMMADVSKLPASIFEEIVNEGEDVGEPFDFRFSKWLIRKHKLGTIPSSAFYSEQHKHLGENIIRFCFIKEDASLDRASEILKKIKNCPC